MNNKMNSYYEQDFSAKCKEVALDVEKSMLPVLGEYISSKSATNSSMQIINNPNMPIQEDFILGLDDVRKDVGASQTEERQKVLVRTNNPKSFNPEIVQKTEPKPVSNVQSGYGYSNSEFNTQSNGGDWRNTLGSVQTLILISTAVLVVMVVFVSLMIMKTLGI